MKTSIFIAFLMCGNLFAQKTKNFQNPLLPYGADPFSTYYKGYYYYTHTIGDKLMLFKTKNLARLKDAPFIVVWTPPVGTKYSKDIWAPEFININKMWYAYFAADDGNNHNHRMYVLENKSEDPFKGTWEFKGKVAAFPDRWAIDGDVFSFKEQLYMIWSGWEGDANGQQNIYIAKMSDPWTIEGNRVLISEPTYIWERQGDMNDAKNPPHVSVNEGPQFLQHDGNAFIVFSSSGCWTDFYNLGLLRCTGDNIMDPKSWVKHPQPIFSTSAENGVYAPGHNSFFKSPDGKEDWILFHANDKPGEGCAFQRAPRMQKIKWNEDGTPNFGVPLSDKELIAIPSE